MHEIVEWWNRVALRTKITGVTVLLLTAGLVIAGVGTMHELSTTEDPLVREYFHGARGRGAWEQAWKPG